MTVLWRSGPIDRDEINDLGQRWICIGLDYQAGAVLDRDGREVFYCAGRFLLEQDVSKVFDWKIGG